MRAFFILLRRELGALFLSPATGGLMAFVWIVTGVAASALVRLPFDTLRGVPVMTELFTLAYWLVSPVAVPLITMRLLAEEKRSGTFETLVTAPVRDGAVVAAKFAAAWALHVALWAPTVVYAVLLRLLAPSAPPPDAGAIAAGLLGVAVTGASLVAFGLLASAVTRGPVAAASLCFAGIALLLLFGLAPYLFHADAWLRLGRYASPVGHLYEFSRGIVDTRALAFHGINAGLALYAALKALESRRWA